MESSEGKKKTPNPKNTGQIADDISHLTSSYDEKAELLLAKVII